MKTRFNEKTESHLANDNQTFYQNQKRGADFRFSFFLFFKKGGYPRSYIWICHISLIDGTSHFKWWQCNDDMYHYTIWRLTNSNNSVPMYLKRTSKATSNRVYSTGKIVDANWNKTKKVIRCNALEIWKIYRKCTLRTSLLQWRTRYLLKVTRPEMQQIIGKPECKVLQILIIPTQILSFLL